MIIFTFLRFNGIKQKLIYYNFDNLFEKIILKT
ncbi:hypothetical protein GUU_04029 [Malacoplasma iowae 695]|nr:hypothetical protein GUU_04029 [Malacoplasma iowae 695]